MQRNYAIVRWRLVAITCVVALGTSASCYPALGTGAGAAIGYSVDKGDRGGGAAIGAAVGLVAGFFIGQALCPDSPYLPTARTQPSTWYCGN